MTIPKTANELSHLESLPDDILSHIFALLDLPTLIRLGQSSRALHYRTLHLGLPAYLIAHPTPSLTLHPSPASLWPPPALIRHNHLSSVNLTRRRFHVSQIGPRWPQPVIPTMALSGNQLVLGTGGKVLVHPLVPTKEYTGKAAGRAREWVVGKRGRGSEADVVGIHEMSSTGGGDGPTDLLVAQFDGTLQRVDLRKDGTVKSKAHYLHGKGERIHTLSCEGGLAVTTSASGRVSTFRVASPWIPAEVFETRQASPGLHSSVSAGGAGGGRGRGRIWSSLLSTSHPSLAPSLYLGQTSSIDIHPLHPSASSASVSPKPARQLHGPDPPSRSSPYAIRFPPLPSSHHPSTLLSAWYDSHLRLHDLRSPSPSATLEMFDPWSWADGSAMYSCAFVSEYWVAGGGARHGTVALFDVRMPKSGWSVFTPGGKGSPVYALEGDGGRLWGVTERRAFVLAWDGSGSREDGLVLPDGRAVVGDRRGLGQDQQPQRVNGWKGRGGKWGWTTTRREEDVGVEEGESASAYEHSQGGVRLFDSMTLT